MLAAEGRFALSVATASSARFPSPGMVHVASYGADVSTPIELHEPLAQLVLVFEHSKNWTEATPLPVSLAVAVTVYGEGSAALMYDPSAGAVSATFGATGSIWVACTRTGSAV